MTDNATNAVPVSDLMTREEVVDYLHLPADVLYKLLKARKIPTIVLAETVLRFSRADIDAWIERTVKRGILD